MILHIILTLEYFVYILYYYSSNFYTHIYMDIYNTVLVGLHTDKTAYFCALVENLKKGHTECT